MGILFSILNASLLGIANVLLKKGYKDFPPSVSFLLFGVFTVLLWAPLGLILGVNFDQWQLGVAVGIISAILGQGIYMYALSKGELSITATLLSTFSIYTILFSILFNNERLDAQTLLLIGLTILGTVIVSLPEKLNKKEFKKLNLVFWPVFAAICIGAADTLTKYFINTTSVGSFLFYVAFAQLFISFIYLKWQGESVTQFRSIFHKFKDYKFAFLGSLLISLSTMCLFLSFNFTLASIASPIGASYPVITLILALKFLKEKLSLKNLIGIIMVLTSIIGIAFINP